MNDFIDWEDVLAMKGLREAVVAYAIAEAPEYRLANGVRPHPKSGAPKLASFARY